MNGEISYRDENRFLYQAVNMFISVVKFGILTWGSIRVDLLLGPVSSGHTKNYIFWHFHIGFIFQPQRLLLAGTVSVKKIQLNLVRSHTAMQWLNVF